MKKSLFVIVHGSYGSPESNWFPALKKCHERIGLKDTLRAHDWKEDIMKQATKIASLEDVKGWVASQKILGT